MYKFALVSIALIASLSFVQVSDSVILNGQFFFTIPAPKKIN
jgi:hypothetical protein